MGEDKITDNNSIEVIILSNYILRTLRMILIITNVCFFFGTFWIIFCELTAEAINSYDHSDVVGVDLNHI